MLDFVMIRLLDLCQYEKAVVKERAHIANFDGSLQGCSGGMMIKSIKSSRQHTWAEVR